MEHVLRADGLCDVPEGVHRRPSDGLLVRLQHLQQLEADAHPLASAHVLGPAVGDTPDQVDAVLLHLRPHEREDEALRVKNKHKHEIEDEALR